MHPRTTHVLFRQPSTILQPSGVTKPVDVDGLGFIQSNWTSASATSAFIQRGSVHKTDINVRNSWRQLCFLKSMPSDDDDDDIMIAGNAG